MTYIVRDGKYFCPHGNFIFSCNNFIITKNKFQSYAKYLSSKIIPILFCLTNKIQGNPTSIFVNDLTKQNKNNSD